MAMTGDPDILTDFIVLPNVTNVDGNFFTFTGLRDIFKGGPSTTLKVSKVSLAEFSALNGQSVSYAVLGYPAGTTTPPYVHPRASELLFVVEGTLQVGFVDTTNKLFTQTLLTGDIFVFPKGLVHFHTMLMHKYLLQQLQHLGVQMLEPFQFPTLCSLLALTMLSWLNPSRPILPPLKLLRLVLLLPSLEDSIH